jgi:HTH-type transcriptional regulator/antitoxin HigA
MPKTIATAISDDYMRLVQELPLKKLRTERDHTLALRMSGRLIGGAGKLTPGEGQYLDALVVLIREYEQSQHDPKRIVPSGIDVLKHLMAEHDMTQRQLGQLLGIGDSAASMILSGTRELTKSHITKLSRHFGVGVGAFFEE